MQVCFFVGGNSTKLAWLWPVSLRELNDCRHSADSSPWKTGKAGLDSESNRVVDESLT